jgi:uncharacterized membrane protein YhaH (DUF805 family)
MHLKWVLWFSIIFYLIACFLNVFKNTRYNEGMYRGGLCLIFGWMSILAVLLTCLTFLIKRLLMNETGTYASVKVYGDFIFGLLA